MADDERVIYSSCSSDSDERKESSSNSLTEAVAMFPYNIYVRLR